MSELSYQMIRSANQAREADEQRTEQRRRSLLVLVMSYLSHQGYLESATTLSKETNLDMSKYDVCDNVDLETVLMEYESYYFVRFQKYPKIIKKLTESGTTRTRTTAVRQTSVGAKSTKATPISNGHNVPRSHSTPTLPRIPPQRSASPSGGRPKSRQGNYNQPKKIESKPPPEEDMLNGLMIQGSNQVTDAQSAPQKPKPKAGAIIDFRSMINDATRLNAEEGQDDKLLKPLGGYLNYSNEWRELAQVISRDIFSSDPNVRWDDIIGLDNPKRVMKEAVVYPIKYPQLFTGILSPWKGLLLYGPPGTGKTLLAKAVATECNTTFFNISASSIVSKWRGDSEKLVRVLFELARFHAPSTIFLDELESLMSQRGSAGGGGEHEGSRRMKTELLVQMDGLAKTDDLVFLLAASNLPWELDHAMLRRLEKRIIVDLPTEEAREAMFRHHLPPVITPESHGLELTSQIDYQMLAKATDGYSGSDIRLVAKEAAMRPVRKVFEVLETHTEDVELHIVLDPVTTADVQAAIAHTKPSARLLTGKYKQWQQEYESV